MSSFDEKMFTEEEYDAVAKECDRLEGELAERQNFELQTIRMQALRSAVRTAGVARNVLPLARVYENYILTGKFKFEKIKDPSNEEIGID